MANQLFFLGTSDGVASPKRAHASILLTLGGEVLLLDCGEPCSHTLVKHGVSVNRIDSVIISHLHSDHVGGFPMVIQWLWLAGRTRPLPVHMPREGIQPFQQLLKATYLFDELLKFDLAMKPLKKGHSFKVGGVKVELCHNRHLEGFRKSFQRKYKNPFESFSFRFTHKKTSVVYSGDLASPSDLDPLLKGKTDVLIVELAHFEPQTLFKYLAQHDVGRIFITHLGSHIQPHLVRTRHMAKRLLPGRKVIFADDEMKVKF